MGIVTQQRRRQVPDNGAQDDRFIDLAVMEVGITE
jgi:hypothetical protein